VRRLDEKKRLDSAKMHGTTVKIRFLLYLISKLFSENLLRKFKFIKIGQE